MWPFVSGPNSLSSGLVISADLSCSLKDFFPDSVFPVLFSASFLLASRFNRLHDLNASKCRREGNDAIYARSRVISFCSLLGLTADIFQGHSCVYTVISNQWTAASRNHSFKCRQSHFTVYRNSCHKSLALFLWWFCNGTAFWAEQDIWCNELTCAW